MESISDIIERKGGYTTVGELSSDSEYRRVLRVVERGEMQKIRHGVYANADALAFFSSLQSSKDNGFFVIEQFQAYRIFYLLVDAPPDTPRCLMQ